MHLQTSLGEMFKRGESEEERTSSKSRELGEVSLSEDKGKPVLHGLRQVREGTRKSEGVLPRKRRASGAGRTQPR